MQNKHGNNEIIQELLVHAAHLRNFASLLLVSAMFALSGNALAQSVVLCNSLGSEQEILNSAVGPGGTFSGGSFTSDGGLFGRDAYTSTGAEDDLVTFPKEVIPADRGTIEFWAKLVNFPTNAGGVDAPRFFQINDSMGARYEIQIQNNDGLGGGGLVTRIGNIRVRTQGFGPFTYASLLGDPTVWHHYAVAWDIDGLSLSGLGGTGTLEHWIDGVRVGNTFAGTGPAFPQPASDLVKLIKNNFMSTTSVQMSSLQIHDFAKLDFSDRSTDACLVIFVSIDIKPDSNPNSINPKSNGKIPVAILSTNTGDGDPIDFDATQVDPLSVEFGPDSATEAHGRGHVEDVDGDEDMDLVLHFKTKQTGISCGDIEASLTGTTFSGDAIEGTDSINTVGCQ